MEPVYTILTKRPNQGSLLPYLISVCSVGKSVQLDNVPLQRHPDDVLRMALFREPGWLAHREDTLGCRPESTDSRSSGRSGGAGFTRLSPDGRRMENMTHVRCTYPIVVVDNVQSGSRECRFSPEPREPPSEPHNPSAKCRVPCKPHSTHSAVRSAAPTLSRSQTAFNYSMVD